MALTLRSVTSNSQDNTSSAVRASFPMEGGKLYVALCAAGGTTPGTETLTSADGNTWTRRKQQLGASSDCVASVWTFAPSADGGDTIDYYNNGDIGARGIWIYEIGGDWDTDFSSTFGVGSSGTHQVSCTGLASINSVVISAGFCRSDGTAETANGSSVLIGNLQFPVAGAWNSFYLYGTGATSITLGTTESSANWCMAVLEIKSVLDSIGLSEATTPGDSLAFSIPVQTSFQGNALQQNAFAIYGGSGADTPARSLSEALPPAESAEGKAGQVATLSEQPAPSDTVQGYLRIRASLSEQPAPADSFSGWARQSASLSEQPGLADSYDYTWVPSGDPLARDLSEQAAPTETVDGRSGQRDSLSEQAAPTETFQGYLRIATSLSEQAAPTDSFGESSRATRTLAESVSPTETVAWQAALRASLSEQAAPTEASQGYLRILASLSEGLSPSDSFDSAISVIPTDEAVREQVIPGDFLAAGICVPLSLSEQVSPTDSLASNWGRSLSEQVSPGDLLNSYSQQVRGSLSEALAPTDSFAVTGKTVRNDWIIAAVVPADGYNCSITRHVTVQRTADPALTTRRVDEVAKIIQNRRRDLGAVIKKGD